ncbi:hypothetical protein ACM64Y_08335 [Novispirillum sp. DQ9]|uniref:hypothetical protein n=1 Tax=Novispirillum sp. DQ9 TaxID=3398612 RepID=UPI003C7E7347
MTASKAQRLAVFLEKLGQAPPARSAAEARQLLETVLNAVEDTLTSIPAAPDQWQTDGRMYAPRDDSARTVPGRPDVTRYRNRNHNTWIGQNGAIRISRSDGACLLDKPGLDGRTVGI